MPMYMTYNNNEHFVAFRPSEPAPEHSETLTQYSTFIVLKFLPSQASQSTSRA